MGRHGKFRGDAAAIDRRRRILRPAYGFFDTDGSWAIEGVGVSPDIEAATIQEL